MEDYNRDERIGTDDALRHIGTNAIPTLLQMLRAKDSPLKTKFIELLGRETSARIKITPAVDKDYEARVAFQALGADASNAVPLLLQIYAEKISLDSQCQTIGALGGIGPAAKSAIPTLLRALNPTNEMEVRHHSVLALGKIHSEPASVVPELVKLLHDSDAQLRRYDAEALGEFGTNAKSAIPDLTIMLNDGYSHARYMATNALKQIDPEAAAKAGIK
ncbi:MAG TPA: HEAT repeat domain-containing protein [Verrucomicrobiae bacterium]|nr:HEAT repeat domain-containing protein [Verrucomicrobiae bacterium]